MGMRELLTCQTSNDQDANVALSTLLNKQLVEAKSSTEDAFVAAMFRASAFLVTSQGTADRLAQWVQTPTGPTLRVFK